MAGILYQYYMCFVWTLKKGKQRYIKMIKWDIICTHPLVRKDSNTLISDMPNIIILCTMVTSALQVQVCILTQKKLIQLYCTPYKNEIKHWIQFEHQPSIITLSHLFTLCLSHVEEKHGDNPHLYVWHWCQQCDGESQGKGNQGKYPSQCSIRRNIFDWHVHILHLLSTPHI